MKCIKFLRKISCTEITEGHILRTDDKSARILVREGKADYVSRSHWREYWKTGNRSEGYLKINNILRFLEQ